MKTSITKAGLLGFAVSLALAFAPSSFAVAGLLAVGSGVTEKAAPEELNSGRDADSGPMDSTAERAEIRHLRKAKKPIQKCDLKDTYCLQRQQQAH